MTNKMEIGEGEALLFVFEDSVSLEDITVIKEQIAVHPEARRVVVDLVGLPLVTTTGLGALVALHKFCIHKERALILTGFSPYVKEIFDLTRLSRIFTIVPTREEALGISGK
jgi:anti-sigma B factor antagonist